MIPESGFNNALLEVLARSGKPAEPELSGPPLTAEEKRNIQENFRLVGQLFVDVIDGTGVA